MNESKNYSKVIIKQKKEGSPFTEVYVNGQKINGVRSYTLKHFPGKVPTLTLDLNALDVTIEEPCILVNPAYGKIKIIQVEEEDEKN